MTRLALIGINNILLLFSLLRNNPTVFQLLGKISATDL